MEDSFDAGGTELEDHPMRAARFMIKAEQELEKLKKAYPDLRYQVLNQTEEDMEMSDGMAKMALNDDDAELVDNLSRQAREDDITSATETTVSIHAEADIKGHLEATTGVLNNLATLEKGVRLSASHEPEENPLRRMQSTGPEREDVPVYSSFNLYTFGNDSKSK